MRWRLIWLWKEIGCTASLGYFNALKSFWLTPSRGIWTYLKLSSNSRSGSIFCLVPPKKWIEAVADYGSSVLRWPWVVGFRDFSWKVVCVGVGCRSLWSANVCARLRPLNTCTSTPIWYQKTQRLLWPAMVENIVHTADGETSTTEIIISPLVGYSRPLKLWLVTLNPRVVWQERSAAVTVLAEIAQGLVKVKQTLSHYAEVFDIY